MLDSAQESSLGVKRLSGSSVDEVNGAPSPRCTWITATRLGLDGQKPFVSFNVQVIPLPTEAAVVPGVSIAEVNGYGSVTDLLHDSSANGPVCEVAVDAAPQRSIRVQAILQSLEPPLADDELCRRASDAASKVMTTVVALAAR